MKQEGQPSAEVPPSGGEPPRAGAVSPDHVVAAAADAHTAKPQPTEPVTEPPPGAPSPAATVPAPERVDWTAMLEERALVPDSEAASPIAEAVVIPGEHGRRRGLLHLLVALTALFSLVASAAVVVALLRDDKAAAPAPTSADREGDGEVVARPPPQEPPPRPPIEPAAGTAAAAGASDPADEAAAASAATGADDDDKARAAAEKREKSERARQARTDKPEKTGKPDKERTAKSDKKPAGDDGKGGDGKGGDGKGDDGKGDDGETAPIAADGNRPDKPSIKDLAGAMKPLEPQIHACAKENGVTGTAAIKLEVGADGKIAWAAVREGGGAFQGCVNKVVRAIRLPASENGGTLIHSVSLPDP